MSGSAKHLDAETAAASLGVSRSTLYAYVSRGLVRTAADPGDPRRRLYDLHDIKQLKKRKTVGKRPRQVAATTLDWGYPVLSSGISLIENGRLFFRGHDAVKWAESASLEDTARLLWACGDDDPFADPGFPVPPWDHDLTELASGLPLIERCQVLLQFVATGRVTAWQRDNRRLWPGAVALLRATTAAATLSPPDTLPIHDHLARSWRTDEAGADILRRALVLLADHELNASAFAARVVASTGASMCACLTAGLSALSGPLHGGTTSLVEILFEECDEEKDPAAAIEKRLRRGDRVPGFGHQLYPDGDPRAAALLPLLPEDAGRTALTDAMAETAGKLPNIDFALVSLRRALGLPPGAALALFAIGRTVGWIAHALEQHAEDRLIRPRAQYTGAMPDD